MLAFVVRLALTFFLKASLCEINKNPNHIVLDHSNLYKFLRRSGWRKTSDSSQPKLEGSTLLFWYDITFACSFSFSISTYSLWLGRNKLSHWVRPSIASTIIISYEVQSWGFDFAVLLLAISEKYCQRTTLSIQLQELHTNHLCTRSTHSSNVSQVATRIITLCPRYGNWLFFLLEIVYVCVLSQLIKKIAVRINASCTLVIL